MMKFRVLLDRPGTAPCDEYGNPTKPIQAFARSRQHASQLANQLLDGQVVGTVAWIYEARETLIEERRVEPPVLVIDPIVVAKVQPNV